MELPGDSPTKRRRHTRRFATFEAIDRRTASYRETRRLIGAIANDLGGYDELSTGEQQLVQRAAVLGAILVDMEAQWLRGERPFDMLGYCTVINAQRRIFEAVGLRRRARDVTTLTQYLTDENNVRPRSRASASFAEAAE